MSQRKPNQGLKVYTCTSFVGAYPVGAAAIVVADSKAEAAHFLELELKKYGLKQEVTADQMERQPIIGGAVRILVDGNY